MTAETESAARRLTADLAALGVRPGQDLLVHCSLRRIGPVDGGAPTLLSALRAATGPDATLVVPAQTAENSLSSRVFLTATASLDKAQLARFVAAMPGFDPATTPSSGMGAFAEHVRTRPGAFRSAHPQSSFAAIGLRAADCMAGHEMACHLGERSPLGWLYLQGAAVLLLGVAYAACTAFHLAEYRLPKNTSLRQYRCFTTEGRVRTEQAFVEINLDDRDFEMLGARIDREPFVHRGRVGNAECRLLPIRDAVDFATAWPPFKQRRAAGD